MHTKQRKTDFSWQRIQQFYIVHRIYDRNSLTSSGLTWMWEMHTLSHHCIRSSPNCYVCVRGCTQFCVVRERPLCSSRGRGNEERIKDNREEEGQKARKNVRGMPENRARLQLFLQMAHDSSAPALKIGVWGEFNWLCPSVRSLSPTLTPNVAAYRRVSVW